MKSVTLKNLKAHLSEYAEEASKGQTIYITKHQKPYILLTGAKTSTFHVGHQVGLRSLKSISKKASMGLYLKLLKEDREE